MTLTSTMGPLFPPGVVACQQPQQPSPPPFCGACPAPATAALHRAPPGSEAIRRVAAARWGRGNRRGRAWPSAEAYGQGDGAKKGVWISYTLTFRWNTRFRRIHARCWSHPSLIEVSNVYQDARLTQDLEYLMTHEAAHFGVAFSVQ